MVKSGFFSPEIIFFRFLKKEKNFQNFKIFDDQNFEKSVNRPEMPIFWSNLGQFWPKWVIFEFSTKKRNRHFFSTPETRLRARN